MAKQHGKKKERKEVEYFKRLEILEKKVRNLDTDHLIFLIQTIQADTQQLNNLNTTIQFQQKFIMDKGLKNEYEKWLQNEIKKLEEPGVENDGGKIKRISESEKGKERPGGDDRGMGEGAEGKDKSTSEPNERGNERTSGQSGLHQQPDSGTDQ